MTFSPHIRRRCCPRVSPPVVPRKPIYVRKAGYSRYRVRRFFPPRFFPSCDKGIVGSECACRVFSTGECRVVPRVLRPDLPDPDVFLFSKRRKTNSFLPYYVSPTTSPTSPKLYPAVAPNRRRITEFSKLNSSAAPERSPADLDGATLVRTRTCTNYIHPIPYIKVLRSFFKSDRSPRLPRLPRISTRTTAPTPNRRRMTLVSRPRTISCGLGRSNIGEQTELHKLHPSPTPI